MSEVQSPASEAAGLTQLQRVTNTFLAPAKTFEDIKRGNRSWWLPFLILMLAGFLFFGVVTEKVGMRQVLENQIRMNGKAQEQMAQATPEQRERATRFWMGFTEGMFLGSPLVGILGAAVISLGLLATINFVFAGRANFGQIFAVAYYAWLPTVVKILLGIAVLHAGMAPESFNAKNFAPTNVGAFLDPIETNKAIYALASSIDIITIWILALMSMGVATVAGVKRSAGYLTVFGWWALLVLISVGWAAAFS